MKKSKHDSSVEKSNEPMQKRTWISPELSIWSAKNLELGAAKSADGGGLSYGP